MEDRTATTEKVHAVTWQPTNLLGQLTVKEFLVSNDYRVISVKGILASLLILALGGIFALTFRAELAYPDIQFFGARTYMGLMTLHGMFMVFGFVIPIVLSVCYYLMPKVLKTDGLLWAGWLQASFWTLIAAVALLIIGRPDFTWTFYAPMSLRVGGNLVWCGYVAIVLVAVSEFLAGAALLRNVFAWQDSWKSLPLLGWAMLTEGGLLILSTPALALVGALLLTDWLQLTAIFDTARGGSTTTSSGCSGSTVIRPCTCRWCLRSAFSTPCYLDFSAAQCGVVSPGSSHSFCCSCCLLWYSITTFNRMSRGTAGCSGSSRS